MVAPVELKLYVPLAVTVVAFVAQLFDGPPGWQV
jgi:hypothetical protein